VYVSNGLKWVALLCGLVVMPAWGQAIPVESFAKHGEISGIAMSPSGKHVAMAVPTADGLETQLQIVPLDGSGKVQVLRFGLQQHVATPIWTDDEQIVVSRAKMEPLHARPYSYGELIASDINGKTQETLFAYVKDDGVRSGRRKDQGFAAVDFILDDEPGNVLVDFTCWPGVCGEESPTVVYKVDTRTGTRKEIERSSKPASFYYDRAGKPRLRITRDARDEPVLHYRPTPGADWQPVPAAMAGYTMYGLSFDTDNNTAYALVSDKREPAQLFRIDFATGSRNLLIGRDDAAVSRLLYAGYDGVPFGVIFDSDKPSIRYVDNGSEWAKLHAGMLKAFPGQMVSIIDFSRDNRKVLFSTWSDRHPGSYYVLDRDAGKVQLISEVRPWIKPEQMAPMRPFEFKSSDGLKLFGFYSAKAGATGPQPLIVMAHGGPYGPYDSWTFDDDVQFLTSRGYAVLQVNFRGSGGRGEAFEQLGYREWGGKMMDDIADGVRWAIDNKLADPERICTYGASFGGYAALMNPIRYPELYKCAIGYVGVYDLQVMHKEGDINDSKSGRRYLDRVLGNDPATLAANSPARNVDKIKIPVMLVQGRLDQRVPMDQFNALENAFKKQGTPVETLVVGGEGHGFYKPENRAELYRRMEAFLAKHLGK
jgi:dipeptidyl aminopeptidase/acylaminoacyl peptidase